MYLCACGVRVHTQQMKVSNHLRISNTYTVLHRGSDAAATGHWDLLQSPPFIRSLESGKAVSVAANQPL